jgi:hypothetical protein
MTKILTTERTEDLGVNFDGGAGAITKKILTREATEGFGVNFDGRFCGHHRTNKSVNKRRAI